jgi:apolipoprotein N-acyltransferase
MWPRDEVQKKTCTLAQHASYSGVWLGSAAVVSLNIIIENFISNFFNGFIILIL